MSVDVNVGRRNRDLTLLRATALQSVRSVLSQHGFVEVTTPEITSATGACENTSTLFGLDYFGKTAFLRQTSQLDLEYLVVRDDIPRVFTIGKSFRKEPRVDDRHLTEFTLIEIEARDWTLEDLIDLQELIVDTVWYDVHLTLPPFQGERYPIITYTDAVTILGLEWGVDLTSTNEQDIVKHFGGTPVHITHYPEFSSFFNMSNDRECNPERQTVAKCDFILPFAGETFGGSEREYDYEIMSSKLYTSPMYDQLMAAGGSDKAFLDYLNLFKDNPVRRAGFGIGFDRLIQWLIQSTDIRDADVFPMNRESI